MPRVLIVEDERKLLGVLERGLCAEGYEVVTASRGDRGYELATTERFDCIVLDLLLPGRDGMQILSDLRNAGNTVPVLVLTARDAIEDRVLGLDAGADDYLVKPFAFAELLARLRVLLRRGQTERETRLRAGTLEVDLLERQALLGGAPMGLSNREFELLVFLVRHKNIAVTRAMLGQDVWKEPSYSLTNVIDVTINSLRRKLEKAGGKGPYIQTVRGVGYSLQETKGAEHSDR
jgi:DNA-binding response OmpR family regulator